jgi:hypothetical protein
LTSLPAGSKLYEIEEKGKVPRSYPTCTVTGLVHITCLAQRCKLVFNAIFNAMRTLPDLTRIFLYQSFIKTAINTAITVKLLTSKVTLLNTCEKLKMTHEKQLELILGI